MGKVALEDVLISVERPYVIQCVTDHDRLFRQVEILAGVRPRQIDLAGCATDDDLFAALILGLSMPYRQLNWNSFDEVMNDLSWLDPGDINMIVCNGVALHRRNPNLFQKLVSLLDTFGAEWKKPVAEGEWWDHPPRPFHVLFVTERKSDLPLPQLSFSA